MKNDEVVDVEMEILGEPTFVKWLIGGFIIIHWDFD